MATCGLPISKGGDLKAANWEEAVSRWQAVLHTHGDQGPANAYVRLAQAHQALGAFGDAEAVSRSGLARYPDNLKLMILFAEAAYKAANWEEAVSRWQAVLHTHGDQAPANAYVRLAQAHEALGAYADAEAVSRSGLARYPDHQTLLMALAEVASEVEDRSKAVSRLQAVLNIRGNKAPVSTYARLARAHQALGRFDDAEAVSQSGLDQYPDNLRLMTLFAEAASKAKDWEEAVPRWRAVLSTHGDDAPAIAYVRLAQAYHAMGAFNDAETIRKAGFDLYPNNLLLLTQCPWQKNSPTFVTKIAKPLKGILSADQVFSLEIECLRRLRNLDKLKHFPFPRLVYCNTLTKEINMEFKGFSLKSLLDSAWSIDVFNLDEQVDRIITLMEQAEIVHLDLYHHNITVDTNGNINVIDFGLAVVGEAPVSELLRFRFAAFRNSGGYQYQAEFLKRSVAQACKIR